MTSRDTMAQMGRVFTALLGLVLSAPAVAQLDQYGGGGFSQSPDRRWRVWSKLRLPEEDTAIAWLTGPSVPKRRLVNYERAVQVQWMADRQHVVLIDRTAHFAWIDVIDLAPVNRHASDRIQQAMQRRLSLMRPVLSTVDNRLIALGRGFADAPCVLIEESGMPPGRTEGNYVARRAAFRLNLARGRIAPIPRCPGAKLD